METKFFKLAYILGIQYKRCGDYMHSGSYFHWYFVKGIVVGGITILINIMLVSICSLTYPGIKMYIVIIHLERCINKAFFKPIKETYLQYNSQYKYTNAIWYILSKRINYIHIHKYIHKYIYIHTCTYLHPHTYIYIYIPCIYILHIFTSPIH